MNQEFLDAFHHMRFFIPFYGLVCVAVGYWLAGQLHSEDTRKIPTDRLEAELWHRLHGEKR